MTRSGSRVAVPDCNRINPSYGGRTVDLTTWFTYVETMQIEYDPQKDAANLVKHKLSLKVGVKIFDDREHLILSSIREVDGEERFKAIGALGGKLHTAIYVWRGDRIRFISVRRSNAGEERAYRNSC